jgi:hypothetical protein
MNGSSPLYEIRVRGHLSAGWSEWFGGLALHLDENGETVLAGPLADQAALLGVLAKLHQLNLDLLAVRQIEE